MKNQSILMRRIASLLLGLLISTGIFAMECKLCLVYDTNTSSAAVAKRFRTVPDLQASASGQFSADELITILHEIPTPRKDIWIVDLRQESHAFVDGLPVSWASDRNAANVNKTAKQIEREENLRVAELKKQKTVAVHNLKKLGNGLVEVENPVIMIPENIETEQSLVQSLNAKYSRLYVLDHNKPDDAEVDNFVNFIRYQVKQDDWLHFHCRGGAGRSSTFIAMYDMIRNAKHVPFIEIMQRQAKLGNINLTEMPTTPNKVWKADLAHERYLFLCKFYAYAKDPKGYATQSFTEWQSLQKK